MARPSKYNPKYHDPWIKGLAQRGATLDEIAAELDVAKSTVQKWVAENEELSVALKKGRGFADSQVEMSLYQRAIGYKVKKKRTVIQASGDDGVQKPARIEIYEEDVPPDVTACIFWLKNRDPEHWKDKHDVDLNNDDWAKALQSLTNSYKQEDKKKGK